MTPVTIKFVSNASHNIIRVNDVALVFDSLNQAVVSLPPGTNVLTWLIKGSSGNKYTLEIVAPATAAFKREITLDSFGLDFGFHEIQL